MKASSSALFTAVGIAILSSSAHASVYFSDFETGYIGGDMTTGANAAQGWTCNDPMAEIGSIQTASPYVVWGNASATMGYVGPTTTQKMYLSHAASTPVTALVGTMNASFSTLFTVQDSTTLSGATARDTFGFRLESGGSELFSFLLTPSEQTGTPTASTENNILSWSTGGGTPTVVLAPLKAAEGSNYTFTVDFYDAGGGVAGFNATIGASAFSGMLGAGTASMTIDKFGAVWNAFNAPVEGSVDTGSNLLIFDNINLVPEPSAALLGALGTLALLRRRRL